MFKIICIPAAYSIILAVVRSFKDQILICAVSAGVYIYTNLKDKEWEMQ